MLLKNIYDRSDEEVVARWTENPYKQCFTGMKVFKKRSPINPMDFSRFRKRACVELLICHLKSDHRMIRNYLSGTLGDAIYKLHAAAAYNLRHWMNKMPHTSFFSCLLVLNGRFKDMIFESPSHYSRLRSHFAMVVK